MMQYKVISRNNGDSYFCIVVNEDDVILTALMPMLIQKHKVQVNEDRMRETFSATQMCPFTDDRIFAFYKNDLLYNKPMTKDAIDFYVTMINIHEEPETMLRYNLGSLIQERDEGADGVEEMVDQLLEDDEGDRVLH